MDQIQSRDSSCSCGEETIGQRLTRPEPTEFETSPQIRVHYALVLIRHHCLSFSLIRRFLQSVSANAEPIERRVRVFLERVQPSSNRLSHRSK